MAYVYWVFEVRLSSEKLQVGAMTAAVSTRHRNVRVPHVRFKGTSKGHLNCDPFDVRTQVLRIPEQRCNCEGNAAGTCLACGRATGTQRQRQSKEREREREREREGYGVHRKTKKQTERSNMCTVLLSL